MVLVVRGYYRHLDVLQSGQRRTRTDTLARMILSQLRLPIPPVALIHSLLIIAHTWVI
jgi:hypothetical protein